MKKKEKKGKLKCMIAKWLAVLIIISADVMDARASADSRQLL